jgi:hypothetical protein
MFNLITYKTYSGASDAKGGGLPPYRNAVAHQWCAWHEGMSDSDRPDQREGTSSVAAALRRRRAAQPPNY